VIVGVYVDCPPYSRLRVDGSDQPIVKLKYELDCVRVTLPPRLLIDAVAVTDAAATVTITASCPVIGEPCPLTCQPTAEATAERVPTVVKHSAVTCTRWYSLVHGIRGTTPPLTAPPPG
jgi:hypothetical protein